MYLPALMYSTLAKRVTRKANAKKIENSVKKVQKKRIFFKLDLKKIRFFDFRPLCSITKNM